MKIVIRRAVHVSFAALLLLASSRPIPAETPHDRDDERTLPTGKRITPLATPGATLESLNPGLAAFPGYVAGQAISTVVSPDNNTLLVLTSGFNRVNGDNGKPIPDASNEYVFVYDISTHTPEKKQVLQVPDTFAGIAFSPDGSHFFVSGGKDDNLHTYSKSDRGLWEEDGRPIQLGHSSGLGLVPGKEPLAAGGLAVTRDGRTVLVANVYNDSISFIDLRSRRVSLELDLRPGKIDPQSAGIPGGEYPFWIAVRGDTTAYVSSLRDREIVEIALTPQPRVRSRIKIDGNPNKMLLNREGSRLFVTADNSDNVTVIDTATNTPIETIWTTGPEELLKENAKYTGSAPNSLALSNDEHTLYVTNGGSNSVAVIQLGENGKRSSILGLIPTGWFPCALSVSGDGLMLYVVNSKTVAGPNPNLHTRIKSDATARPGPAVVANSRNEYVLQLEKAGLLSIPVPTGPALDRLTQTVAANNGFTISPSASDRDVMKELKRRIKHVIYIIKENRTYDQILGDLGRGNGDPSLTEFGESITPNFHQIARQFVDLDNFYNSGEVSGDGWPWSTSGRESDFGEKAVVLNYAGRGTNYEYEGLNRDINVGLATASERKAANPKTPDDPDLLPGASNVAAPDGPKGTPREKGYIWDAVLRAGLSFREYGCMSDTTLNAPREPYPFKANIVMSRPANPESYKFGDPYFRGFDPGYPDFYREAEWEREFDQYTVHDNLPAFEIVQLQEDHMGEFAEAISKVNTPETQQADNDYAVGRLLDRLAHSAYKTDTLVFIVEDDAQDGPDHVDAHRSTAYVVGPYVKQGKVVSNYYTTVSVIRTIEDVLGLDHLNLNTATTAPMADVFDLHQDKWTFEAQLSSVLAKTDLPLSETARKSAANATPVKIAHGAQYWAMKTRGFDFSEEDRVDAGEFNRIVWEGLMSAPYPIERSGPAPANPLAKRR
ncbi:MAG: phosphoesterase [Acidobacteriota bacterium]|nr:phosphoesterase [Acidobacteriota bacterium]